MASFQRYRWTATLDAGLPRRDRTPCPYDAYLPDPLGDRAIRMDGDVAADIADAEAAIARHDASARALVDTEYMARLLLRAESVASSRIEGLEVGHRRLLRAERESDLSRDATALEVLRNVDAMRFAIDVASREDAVTVAHVLEMHRILLTGTHLDAHAGQVRTVQNWIGGSAYNPCSAAFVPPPPDLVPGLLDDLCGAASDDALPALAQAALVHAQFETIHPFVDGNGRVGRALIHVVLRRRGLTSRVGVPVSLILATLARDYVAGLTATRYTGPADSAAAHEGINAWLRFFAMACRRAVADAERFEGDVDALVANWRSRLGRVRAGSAVDLLIRRLPGVPLITVTSAAELLGLSFQSANEAVSRLVATGVLRPTSGDRRNRLFEATEAIDLFTLLERRLASPEADTLSSPPRRRVPSRASRR